MIEQPPLFHDLKAYWRHRRGTTIPWLFAGGLVVITIMFFLADRPSDRVGMLVCIFALCLLFSTDLAIFVITEQQDRKSG